MGKVQRIGIYTGPTTSRCGRSRDPAPRPELLQVPIRAVVRAAEGLPGRDGTMRSGAPSNGRYRQGHGEVVTADGSDAGSVDRQRYDLQPAIWVCGVHRASLRCFHETDPWISAASDPTRFPRRPVCHTSFASGSLEKSPARCWRVAAATRKTARECS